MRNLVQVAKDAGVREIYSIDSSENSAMAGFARFLGSSRELDPQDATQVAHRLLLAGD